MAALSPKLKLSKNPLRIHRINSAILGKFWVSFGLTKPDKVL